MKIFKRLPLLFLSLLIFFLGPTKIKAVSDFNIDAVVSYTVLDSGKTNVVYNISIENNFTDRYAPSYSLILEDIDVQNVRAEGADGTAFNPEVTKNENTTVIKVTFPDKSVGKGVTRNFSISYENSNFAVKTGEVWEISIPRLGDQTSYRNFTLNLSIPKSFGLEAYISPKPETSQVTDNGYIYSFSKDTILLTGISAGYGQFQVFSFNINYNLSNSIPVSAIGNIGASTVEIALPPDTAYQKVYIQKITPKPINVKIDQDGNWIAEYSLKPQDKITVNVVGAVQIFASYRSFVKPSNAELNDDLKATQYWQVDDSTIRELAERLKTPKAIYDYVSETLHYNSDRVQPNVKRMGALSALQNPNQAICMEFTDLFIAIARAAGIPAREIEGYAYTENPSLEPLGLVADVLHAWPEYYDKDKGVWVPVDPTWGSTSGGVDYFNKLDLRHFAFVIHGSDDSKPYAAGSYKFASNPQKDVFVSFGQLPTVRTSIPSVTLKPFRVLPFFDSIYTATFSNPGPVALYSLYGNIYYDSTLKDRQFIDALPPFSERTMQIKLPYSFLGKNTPNIIEVNAGLNSAKLFTNKKQIVLYSLLSILAFLFLIMLVILIKLKKIKLLPFFAKILGLNKKNGKKYSEQSQKN